MILKQYYLGCLAHASYLIGDEETGTVVVVDPQRDIDQYLTDAEAQGLRIGIGEVLIFTQTSLLAISNYAIVSAPASTWAPRQRRSTMPR